MTEKKEQTIPTVNVATTGDELRFLPFAVAGVVCFTIAVILGTGSWFVFGSRNRSAKVVPELTAVKSEEPEAAPAPVVLPTAEATVAPTPEVVQPPTKVFENVVEVPGGEIGIGGEGTKMPLQRAIVKGFWIAATEVTNAQYADFVKATGHRPPAGWKGAEFPKGTAEFPVSNVSVGDAQAFCKWLADKLGAPVRLPTEAEWEFAARGTDGRRFPWGAKWDKSAALSKESGGKVGAVKSFPANRSPFGAFDMAGNVWEWTMDKAERTEGVEEKDLKSVKEALDEGKVLRIVKGGSALIPADQISAQARFLIPENARVPTVGFRYIIERAAAE